MLELGDANPAVVTFAAVVLVGVVAVGGVVIGAVVVGIGVVFVVLVGGLVVGFAGSVQFPVGRGVDVGAVVLESRIPFTVTKLLFRPDVTFSWQMTSANKTSKQNQTKKKKRGERMNR